MAIGDDAQKAGFSLVPDTGAEGRVKFGAREINRTRDFVAQVLSLIPKSKNGFREAAGIRSGQDEPTGGSDDDIYIQVPGGVWVKKTGVWRRV